MEQWKEDRQPTGTAVARAQRSALAQDRWILLAAAVAPIVTALVLTPWRGHLDAADNALFLVVVIVAVASTGRRMAAVVAALVSALSFDFFLTRPYNSFRITRQADLITEILLLVLGLAVGELAARGRNHREAAGQSRREVSVIHSMTELAASGQDPRVLIAAASAELRKLLFLRDCEFTHEHRRILARVSGDGDVILAGERWSTEDLGLPTRTVDLPVRGNGWLLGHFVLTPTPGKSITHERVVVAVAIADQVGATLAMEQPIPTSKA
jgi:K+-sensing histidine kinase KdpD